MPESKRPPPAQPRVSPEVGAACQRLLLLVLRRMRRRATAIARDEFQPIREAMLAAEDIAGSTENADEILANSGQVVSTVDRCFRVVVAVSSASARSWRQMSLDLYSAIQRFADGESRLGRDLERIEKGLREAKDLGSLEKVRAEIVRVLDQVEHTRKSQSRLTGDLEALSRGLPGENQPDGEEPSAATAGAEPETPPHDAAIPELLPQRDAAIQAIREAAAQSLDVAIVVLHIPALPEVHEQHGREPADQVFEHVEHTLSVAAKTPLTAYRWRPAVFTFVAGAEADTSSLRLAVLKLARSGISMTVAARKRTIRINSPVIAGLMPLGCSPNVDRLLAMIDQFSQRLTS